MKSALRQLLELNTRLQSESGISLSITVEGADCHVIASASLNYVPRVAHFTADVDDEDDMQEMIKEIQEFQGQLTEDVYERAMATLMSLIETTDRRFMKYLTTDTGIQQLKERITMRYEAITIRG